ncbi:MAG: hypothetical protein K2F57_06075 [Candidatus Gastranaerophilales bacterium]|nr:hypothetical protein [Candidatus Gastranaerophilales bacterium]
MKTLHELATKLQQYIIKSQQDAHNSTNMNITKYNNLKLRMETKLHYPNVIVTIGISEATFNIREGTKTDGSLGPDERYVKKWLGGSTVIADLKEIYIAMSDLIKAEDENKSIALEGEADEAKKDTPRKQKFKELLNAAMPIVEEFEEDNEDDEELLSVEESLQEEYSASETSETEPETVEQVKKGLKDMLKSMFRRK